MLSELIQYSTINCDPYVRKMGYLSESIATYARYKRCRKSWDSHLQNTKEQIQRFLPPLFNKRKVLIIGSGNFLDIPIKSLSEQFDKVICVDVVFSRVARKIVEKYNIEAHELDITAVAEKIFYNKDFLPQSAPLFFLEDGEIDLVVSCNILSQLSYIPVKWLSVRSDFSKVDLYKYSSHIIKGHIDYLNAFPARSLLITDMSFSTYNHEDVLLESLDALYGVKLPTPAKTWTWDIAPLGEFNRHKRREHQVGVFVAN